MAAPQTRQPIDLVLRPFQRFINLEASGGIVLFFVTILAFAWANSPWADSYFAYWRGSLEVGAGKFRTTHSIHHWINDGLMTVFFFVMGMEIKRELIAGELKNIRVAALPILAALGGVVCPAVIYSIVANGTDAMRGWAIPTATDIAFSLGVLAVLGSRVPVALKIFLAALAIADDIVAVAVIAFFYTSDLSYGALAAAAMWFAAAYILNITGVRHPAIYAAVGLGLWVSVLASGVHATIAGVLLAIAIPTRSRIDSHAFIDEVQNELQRFESRLESPTSMVSDNEALEAIHQLEQRCEQVQPLLMRFQHALHPWVSFGIMPLFALANAGVRVVGEGSPDLMHPAAVGAALGLALGKPLGVTLFAWLAVKLGIASLPQGVNWRHIHGAGWLAGIGFTMALFVGELAFGESPALAAAKIAILGASVFAGIVGTILLLRNREQTL